MKRRLRLPLAGELGQRLDFVVVDAADDDRVDLDRVQAKFLRQADAGQDLVQAVAAGDLLEIVAVERIQAEADAAQAGLAQRRRLLREEEAVGGHRQVGDAGNPGDARDQFLDVVAQQRFAAGEPDFLDAQADGEAHDALDFLEGEDVGPGHPLLHDGRRIGQVRPMAAIEILRRLGLRAGNRGSGNCSGP